METISTIRNPILKNAEENNNYQNNNSNNNSRQKSDDDILEKFGYQSVLFRGLGLLMNMGFGFVEVAVLASFTSLYGSGLISGGPVVVVWGFIGVSIMMILSSISMAEICSAYPFAGSVYHWAGQLAPKKDAALWSYVTGCLNFFGNAAGDASFAYSFAQFLNSGIEISGGDPYNPQEIVAVAIGTIFLWSAINFFPSRPVGIIYSRGCSRSNRRHIHNLCRSFSSSNSTLNSNLQSWFLLLLLWT